MPCTKGAFSWNDARGTAGVGARRDFTTLSRMAAFVDTMLRALRTSASDAWRYARANRTGLAALGTLVLIVFAVLRRRFKLGMILFQVAVALGEKWQETRARRRVGALLTARPTGDSASDISTPPPHLP